MVTTHSIYHFNSSKVHNFSGMKSFTMLYNRHQCLIPDLSDHPKWKPYSHQSSFHTPSSLQLSATTNCFLYLWVCLFWMCHIHGITQCVALCVWLLLCNMVSSGFLPMVVCISTSFLSMVELYSIVWADHIVMHSSVHGHLGSCI